MKKPKMLIGLCVVLLAGLSAFATVKTKKFVQYYYIDDLLGCTTAPDVPDCSGTAHPCLGTVSGIDNGKQLFSDIACNVPLKKP
ncbi:hypothetical protein DBR11_00045 [Pedobacter sp. HMWF019]|uniref:hypothetical protein n=1 Tax=Pedobacter sp. HMWF019 TaxID=2056856 RepID=UPI000D379694|nr:hypothetical protein [Pedobacter sp. HMWF019]PTT04258.1 hypothetical protein DBR11_00045 [Pedobacter sp. HMWF019]